MKKLGNDFDLKDFHRQLLEIGPVQFPVLQKYMNLDLAAKEKNRELPAGSSPFIVICMS